MRCIWSIILSGVESLVLFFPCFVVQQTEPSELPVPTMTNKENCNIGGFVIKFILCLDFGLFVFEMCLF